MLEAIDGMTGLDLHEVAPGVADLRLANSGLSYAHYAYLPDSPQAGQLWMSAYDYGEPVRGNYFWFTMLRESARALGLDQPDLPVDDRPYDSLAYSIMNGAPRLVNGYDDGPGVYPQSLMILDIAALQRMYGADYGFNATDTVYRWDQQTGEMFVNGVGQGEPLEGRVLMTIWDGGGIDTYDLSGSHYGRMVDLRPGHWISTGHLSSQLAPPGTGNVANALLYQDDPRSLIENAIGNQWENIFVGNAARNQFTGNGGGDTIKYYSVADIGLGATADAILDFRGEWIDLTEIDADSRTPENDAFVSIGQAAFSGVGGQLRYEPTADGARIFGDVDGDAVADFQLDLHKWALADPHMPVDSSNFIYF